MQKTRSYFLLLFCLVLLLGAGGCQRKGIIPCPKPTSKRTAKIKGASSLEAIQVSMDKHGRVKKRN